MKTILSQLPNYIANYPPSEQVHLTEFLSVIQAYNVDTRTDREQLISRFESLIHKSFKKPEYYDLPFLWFIGSYLSTAAKLLSVASFHADDFYKYLVRHLRGGNNTRGAFELISKGTPLSNIAWERLQYACTKLSVPLMSEELHVLETVHDLCRESGINALNPSYIKTSIVNRIKSSKIPRKLNQLFTRLDAVWYSRFYPPSIGLEFLFFHFQLSESSTLREIIDFHNGDNTTLCSSYIYRIRGFHNMFYGFFVIPTYLLEALRTYLEKCEHQGLLILHELSKVNTTRVSFSLALYRPNKGWCNPTITERGRLAQLLKTKHPRRKRVKLQLFLSPPFNEYWNYKQYSKPSQIIALYCKFYRRYSYEMLHFISKINKTFNRFSKPELDILEELFLNRVTHVFFIPNRLFSEFSIDFYWIKIPRMPFEQLSRFLAWLPHGLLLFTSKNINLEAYLTPELAQWIRDELEWTIMPIERIMLPKQPTFDWYSSNNNQWKPPLILKTDF